MIVFCHLNNDRSGSPSVLSATIEALNAYDSGVLYVGSQGHGALEETNILTRRYWYRRSRYRLITLFSFLFSQILLYWNLSMAKDIPRHSIVFVNTLLPFGAMLWARRNKLCLVVHVHEISITPFVLRWFLTSCASRCAYKLIYVSNDHLARLPISGPGAVVITNPVSPKFTANVFPYSSRRSGDFRVLMLTSLRGYKGIEEFMSLAKRLRKRTDIVFDLVLNAEKSEMLSFYVRHAGANNVKIHPRTDDPASFYRKADLVLNLTRVDQCIETFGLTLIEAMAFGVPVIAPPLGGPAEIITHGLEGYCIDSREEDVLDAAVLELADSPDRVAVMSMAALKRSKEFSFEDYSSKLRDFLTQLQDDWIRGNI